MARMQSEVINTGNREYVEEFEGQTIRIPANGKILMDHKEAVKFVGRYTGKDSEGNLKPKPLKVKRLGEVRSK